ncbi:hypothetical protein HELRODRAFT_174211 [Helobdella robusta]|uniref:Uncharacterized protein n=1 Tax=Helobdella robusta TaxID=6412 RepID=T1F7T0_HELRO|nr:hypothetical protein HELRODRAFT_174211 [Helobdella robusta]ESO02793.1 hypothetical protein HELRODRAFT_174211 [Helobdella robusta]
MITIESAGQLSACPGYLNLLIKHACTGHVLTHLDTILTCPPTFNIVVLLEASPSQAKSHNDQQKNDSGSSNQDHPSRASHSNNKYSKTNDRKDCCKRADAEELVSKFVIILDDSKSAIVYFVFNRIVATNASLHYETDIIKVGSYDPSDPAQANHTADVADDYCKHYGVNHFIGEVVKTEFKNKNAQSLFVDGRRSKRSESETFLLVCIVVCAVGLYICLKLVNNVKFASGADSKKTEFVSIFEYKNDESRLEGDVIPNQAVDDNTFNNYSLYLVNTNQTFRQNHSKIHNMFWKDAVNTSIYNCISVPSNNYKNIHNKRKSENITKNMKSMQRTSFQKSFLVVYVCFNIVKALCFTMSALVSIFYLCTVVSDHESTMSATSATMKKPPSLAAAVSFLASDGSLDTNKSLHRFRNDDNKRSVDGKFIIVSEKKMKKINFSVLHRHSSNNYESSLSEVKKNFFNLNCLNLARKKSLNVYFKLLMKLFPKECSSSFTLRGVLNRLSEKMTVIERKMKYFVLREVNYIKQNVCRSKSIRSLFLDNVKELFIQPAFLISDRQHNKRHFFKQLERNKQNQQLQQQQQQHKQQFSYQYQHLQYESTTLRNNILLQKSNNGSIDEDDDVDNVNKKDDDNDNDDEKKNYVGGILHWPDVDEAVMSLDRLICLKIQKLMFGLHSVASVFTRRPLHDGAGDERPAETLIRSTLNSVASNKATTTDTSTGTERMIKTSTNNNNKQNVNTECRRTKWFCDENLLLAGMLCPPEFFSLLLSTSYKFKHVPSAFLDNSARQLGTNIHKNYLHNGMLTTFRQNYSSKDARDLDNDDDNGGDEENDGHDDEDDDYYVGDGHLCRDDVEDDVVVDDKNHRDISHDDVDDNVIENHSIETSFNEQDRKQFLKKKFKKYSEHNADNFNTYKSNKINNSFHASNCQTPFNEIFEKRTIIWFAVLFTTLDFLVLFYNLHKVYRTVTNLIRCKAKREQKFYVETNQISTNTSSGAIYSNWSLVENVVPSLCVPRPSETCTDYPFTEDSFNQKNDIGHNLISNWSDDAGTSSHFPKLSLISSSSSLPTLHEPTIQHSTLQQSPSCLQRFSKQIAQHNEKNLHVCNHVDENNFMLLHSNFKLFCLQEKTYKKFIEYKPHFYPSSTFTFTDVYNNQISCKNINSNKYNVDINNRAQNIDGDNKVQKDPMITNSQKGFSPPPHQQLLLCHHALQHEQSLSRTPLQPLQAPQKEQQHEQTCKAQATQLDKCHLQQHPFYFVRQRNNRHTRKERKKRCVYYTILILHAFFDIAMLTCRFRNLLVALCLLLLVWVLYDSMRVFVAESSLKKLLTPCTPTTSRLAAAGDHVFKSTTSDSFDTMVNEIKRRLVRDDCDDDDVQTDDDDVDIGGEDDDDENAIGGEGNDNNNHGESCSNNLIHGADYFHLKKVCYKNKKCLNAINKFLFLPNEGKCLKQQLISSKISPAMVVK